MQATTYIKDFIVVTNTNIRPLSLEQRIINLGNCSDPQKVAFYSKILIDYRQTGAHPAGLCREIYGYGVDYGCRCHKCGGCFYGLDDVIMADGSFKKVFSLEKGDIVAGGAEIVAKIVMSNADPLHNLVTLPDGGPTMTAYHPVSQLLMDTWQFPIDIAPINRTIICNTVYNFVLSRDHILTVNGWDCITLGHGRNDNTVLAHPYFGTNKVIEDLQKQIGYSDGYVILMDPVMTRSKDGLVTGFTVSL